MHESITAVRAVQATHADHVEQWLSRFDQALNALDRRELEQLFIEDSHWRDLVAFTWTVTPSDSREAIVSTLLREQPRVKARGFRITKGRTPPRQVKRAGMDVIEAIYEFETAVGRGQGVLRLPAARPERAWVISTSLRELKGHEEPVNGRRRAGGDQRIFGGEPWAERRLREQEYKDRDP